MSDGKPSGLVSAGGKEDPFQRAEREVCRVHGHEWVPADDTLDYCLVCQREKWADETVPIPLMEAK